MNLQTQIEGMVRDYAPKDRAARTIFIDRLRRLVEDYGRAAIQHGNLPNVGEPHDGIRRPQ